MKDRVLELRRVKASNLRPNPKNWRSHPPDQRTALTAMLDKVGMATALVARELDDGTLELIPKARARLTVPVLPYSAIARAGATMYRGQPGGGTLDDSATQDG